MFLRSRVLHLWLVVLILLVVVVWPFQNVGKTPDLAFVSCFYQSSETVHPASSTLSVHLGTRMYNIQTGTPCCCSSELDTLCNKM